MRWSEYTIATRRDYPSDAELVSHQLMIKAGMIDKLASGLYFWLPIGERVIRKISNIIRDEMHNIDCHEVISPTIQPASLWEESGRLSVYGKEMLTMEDRHGRGMIYAPTAEEAFTRAMKSCMRSYRDLPRRIFNIQWKFRDEIRPRHGVMRCREFLMKDGYSFDIDIASGEGTYWDFYHSYCKIFDRIGLPYVPARSSAGQIGGNLNHEFILFSDTGETEVYFTPGLKRKDPGFYAATDEAHENNEIDGVECKRGLEVGHIFFFGDKYSQPMDLQVANANGKRVNVQMGSYGIGVGRLVAAVIEASHDEHGMIWPEVLAPFRIGLVNAKQRDSEAVSTCEELYGRLPRDDVLYDDRDERYGVKRHDMDLIGITYQIVVVGKGMFEVKERSTGILHTLDTKKLWEFLEAKCLI